MVATQNTSSHFVGHIPPDFCLVYVWHFVSFTLRLMALLVFGGV